MASSGWISHVKPTVAEETGKSIRMGEVGCDGTHGLKAFCKLGTEGAIGKDLMTFQKVGEHLQVVGGAQLEMHTIAEDLRFQLYGEESVSEPFPMAGLISFEKPSGPQEGFDVFDEVISPDIQFEMRSEMPDLTAERSTDFELLLAAGPPSIASPGLHPDHYAQGEGVAVPSCPPCFAAVLWVRPNPIQHEGDRCFRVQALQVFHVMEVHGIELGDGRIPIHRKGEGKVPAEKGGYGASALPAEQFTPNWE